MQLPELANPRVIRTLAKRGVLRPMRPDKLVRILRIASKWGRTVAAASAINALRWPDGLALVDDDGQLSFSDVHLRSNSLARALRELGLKEQDRIGVLCQNGRAFVDATFAAAKLGCDVVLLNTSFAAPQLARALTDQRTETLVYDPGFDELVTEASEGLDLVRVTRSPAAQDSGYDIEKLIRDADSSDLEPPQYRGKTIVLTSGTTGTPKGASRPKPETLEPIVGFLDAVPRRARGVCLIAPPLYHLHGNAQLELGCALGSTVVLTKKFDSERALELIDQFGVSEVVAVPLMLRRLLDLSSEIRSKYRIDSLELVLCSGSALNYALAKEFMDEFGEVVYNLYGATELSWATIATPTDLLDAPGTIGKPPKGTRLEVLSDRDQVLGPEQVGRLFVQHGMLFEGYTDRGSDRPSVDGMMSVGDLGHYDSKGYFYVDAREDDMIVSGGENVYPGEVEELLANHPQITEVAVVGVEDDQWGQALEAYVVLDGNSDLDSDAVRHHVRDNLARYKVPRSVRLVNELPRNQIGKVLKRELTEDPVDSG